MIFGGTENKEKVWEYEQMYASKEELKWLKSFNRVSRIIDRETIYWWPCSFHRGPLIKRTQITKKLLIVFKRDTIENPN